MKILYVFDSQDHEVFKMSDLPPSFEILREGKKPIVFKPATLQMQDILSRLNKTEELLKKTIESSGWFINKDQAQVAPPLNRAINEYFDRYEQ